MPSGTYSSSGDSRFIASCAAAFSACFFDEACPDPTACGALGDKGMGGKHTLMIGPLALHRISDFAQTLRL